MNENELPPTLATLFVECPEEVQRCALFAADVFSDEIDMMSEVEKIDLANKVMHRWVDNSPHAATTPAPAGEVQSKSLLKLQAVQRGEEIPSGYVTIERHECELAAIRQQVAELTEDRNCEKRMRKDASDRADELEDQLSAAREAIREVRGSGIAYTNEGRYHEVQIGVELWERLLNLTEHHADDDELVDEKFANSLGLKQKSDSGYCWVLGVGGVGRTIVLSNPRGVIGDDVWYLSLGGVNLNIVVTRRDVRRLAAALGVTLKEQAEGGGR